MLEDIRLQLILEEILARPSCRGGLQLITNLWTIRQAAAITFELLSEEATQPSPCGPSASHQIPVRCFEKGAKEREKEKFKHLYFGLVGVQICFFNLINWKLKTFESG